MNSIKRTIVPVPRKYSRRSSTVWSFTPFCTTTLILIGPRPASSAALIPARTFSRSPLPPLILRKISLSILSRLTVTLCSPAAASFSANNESSIPFVVNARSSIPGNITIRSTKSQIFLSSSGSPPVRRILLTPKLLAPAATLSISS